MQRKNGKFEENTVRTGACCEALCSRIGYGPSDLRSGLRILGDPGSDGQKRKAASELEMGLG